MYNTAVRSYSQVDVNVRKDEIIYLKLLISNLKHFHWLTEHTLTVHIPAQPYKFSKYGQ